ncbi:hypothetical protein HUJ04_011081 [Dendroctonus ponderosae]|nr:hypothetical protein HUJ04_011081 [Dendroctonus ponderosae]
MDTPVIHKQNINKYDLRVENPGKCLFYWVASRYCIQPVRYHRNRVGCSDYYHRKMILVTSEHSSGLYFRCCHSYSIDQSSIRRLVDFCLSAFVNKRNCRIWSNENSPGIVEKPMHPERATAWCGLWSSGVIGPYFFENEVGQAGTVNRICYREMITAFLWPEIEDMDLDDMWLEQDGATCHTANETKALLLEKFSGRVLSRRGDWSRRSGMKRMKKVEFIGVHDILGLKLSRMFYANIKYLTLQKMTSYVKKKLQLELNEKGMLVYILLGGTRQLPPSSASIWELGEARGLCTLADSEGSGEINQ